MTITPVLFHSSLRVETSWRFCALSTFAHSIVRDAPVGAPLSAGLHLVVSRRRFRHPSYPRVVDATVQTQEARNGGHPLTRTMPPVRLPSHAGPRFPRLKPGEPGTGNLGQVGRGAEI